MDSANPHQFTTKETQEKDSFEMNEPHLPFSEIARASRHIQTSFFNARSHFFPKNLPQ